MASLEYLVNRCVIRDPARLSVADWTRDDFSFVFQGLLGKDGVLGRKGEKGELGVVGLRGIKVKASITSGDTQ